MHSIFDFKTMDLRSYFSKASTSTSASRLSSNSSEDESEVESSELEVSPPKKHCTSTVGQSTPTTTKKHAKYRSTTSSRKYNARWEKDFTQPTRAIKQSQKNVIVACCIILILRVTYYNNLLSTSRFPSLEKKTCAGHLFKPSRTRSN